MVYVCAGEKFPFFVGCFFVSGQISDMEKTGLAQLFVYLFWKDMLHKVA